MGYHSTLHWHEPRLYSISRTREPRLMSPINSAAPLLLHRLWPRSSTTPPPAFWSPVAAFAAATERVRAWTLRPEDARHLFDELLRQATPVPGRFLNAFLAALACAPASDACRDGPALAVALVNRVRREEAAPQVVPLSVRTYSILMDCCCHARRPDLGLAIFGCLLRMGLKTNVITGSIFLKCLCCATRTDEAVNVLLHKMSELGCSSNVVSYNTVIHGLCAEGKVSNACNLFHEMMQQGVVPNVVTYNIVIHGLCAEGKVSKAWNLFDEMKRQWVAPNVVTYTSIIDALCKARTMDKAELVLRQMVDNGVQPNKVTYNAMIHGYSSLGRRKEAGKMFGEMRSRGLIPNQGLMK